MTVGHFRHMFGAKKQHQRPRLEIRWTNNRMAAFFSWQPYGAYFSERKLHQRSAIRKKKNKGNCPITADHHPSTLEVSVQWGSLLDRTYKCSANAGFNPNGTLTTGHVCCRWSAVIHAAASVCNSAVCWQSSALYIQLQWQLKRYPHHVAFPLTINHSVLNTSDSYTGALIFLCCCWLFV